MPRVLVNKKKPEKSEGADSGKIDVLVLHDRPYDDREEFKESIVTSIRGFLDRAPVREIRAKEENRNWDIGADANISLVSVMLATGLESIGASYKIWDMDNLVRCVGSKVIVDLLNRPRLLAISSSHYSNERQFSELIEFVRKWDPDVPIIVGGQLLRICPNIETIIPTVNYFVHGDREHIFPKLVDLLLNHDGVGIDKLPGVVFKTPDGFDGNRNIELVDINAMEIPRWDLVLKKDFNEFAPAHSPIMPMVFLEEIRGCMYKCSFCSYPLDNPFRLKSVDRIIREIRQYVDWGFTHFNFYSALFTSPPKHCRAVLKRIIAEDLGITFSCQARADNLYKNPDLLQLLREAGCIHMSIGIESGDSAQLRRMRKRLNIEKSIQIMQQAQENGISVVANIFLGFPGETQESIENSYRFILACNLWGIYLSTFVVENASEVFRKKEAFNLEVSEDGRSWRHPTMDSAEAERETARFFIRLARDPNLRTVLWVIQWRLTRFFPQIVKSGEDPMIWNTLRKMQEGIANELEYNRFDIGAKEHTSRQEALWKDIMRNKRFFSDDNNLEVA